MASDEKRSAIENVQRMLRAMMDDVTYYPNVERAKRDLEASVEELSALRAENAAIAKYACHRGNCIYYGPHPVVTAERPCSCGLSALLRKDGERG